MFFAAANGADAVAGDLLAAVVANRGDTVVADQLFQVALGAQVDFLLPGAVFDHQLVVATIDR
ncbi:hypothetical protein D3C84_1225790 [compost metagenome]